MIVYKEHYIKNAPSEGMEQVTFFNQLREKKPHLAAVATHIKNEGKRTNGQIAADKANGLVTGALDINIPGNPSLLIELKKRSKRAKVSDDQVAYAEAASALGCHVYFCWGWEAAWEAVEEWENARGR